MVVERELAQYVEINAIVDDRHVGRGVLGEVVPMGGTLEPELRRSERISYSWCTSWSQRYRRDVILEFTI